ncbi:MAG: hypothetical protein WBA98_15965 [Gordonia sp. (in: high G+C Gram-positive bacteria)]|uniref:hypothetical protein n=1 Tax=Gordonia sp. (in: high G+C Gram-positive bacteria) TaxID=84139 RepID=UPI003C753CA5
MGFGDDFNSGSSAGSVAGIVLVARGDERIPAGESDVPGIERLMAAVSSLGAGGCDSVYVALGARVVPAPDTISTTLYLPEWYDSLDACVRAALSFVDQHPALDGAVLQTLDSPDPGPSAVSRVLAVAAQGPNTICRAEFAGKPAQPVYLGADRIREAIEQAGAGLTTVRYLIDHRNDVVGVDCTDLGNPANSVL